MPELGAILVAVASGACVFPDELIAHYADFTADPGKDPLPDIVVAASEKIAAVYADLLGQGVDDAVVARAMIGATVSLYDALGLAPMLPKLLRVVADKVEKELVANDAH